MRGAPSGQGALDFFFSRTALSGFRAAHLPRTNGRRDMARSRNIDSPLHRPYYPRNTCAPRIYMEPFFNSRWAYLGESLPWRNGDAAMAP